MGDKGFLESRKLELDPELGSIICSYSRLDDLADWGQAFPKHFAYLYVSIDTGTGHVFDVHLADLIDVCYIGGWCSHQHSLSPMSYIYADTLQLQRRATGEQRTLRGQRWDTSLLACLLLRSKTPIGN